MKKIFRISAVVLVIFVPLVLLLGLLFNNLSKRSFYPTSGEINAAGLKSPVKIYFDNFGIPQVFAQNEDDAYFLLGYLHARDRLWQMDLTRRVAEGRLSELFGNISLNYDILFRTIGINRFCYSWYNNISPKSKQILDSYTKGVNNFIETHYDNLPVEFDVLNYRPDPWKPENSLMVARLMGWDLNIAWYTDYVLGEIINKVGIEKTSEIFPDTNIVLFKKPVVEDTIEREKENASVNSLKQIASLGSSFFSVNRDYRKFLGINGAHIGSNAWVISGERTDNGKPMLANDPHLGLQAPSKWYEVYLKGGELDVRGMTIAGAPGVIIGNNRFISWGLTNLMNDDNDYLILNRDSTNADKYIYKGASYYLDSISENIYVKDSQEVVYKVKITKAGPVISNLTVRGFADFKQSEKNSYKEKLLTFLWTGFEPSDEINSLYKINTAKSWDNFREGLKDFNVPAMNFMYADIYGNIGYQAAGKIPIRKTDDFKNYLYPSTSGEVEWTGFIDFDKLPNQYNPKEGYIITANTNPFEWLKTDPKDRFYISYLWESSSRYDRIKQFISSRAVFDEEDFRLMQNSVESPYAVSISKYIPAAYNGQNTSDNNIIWCMERFTGWNGEMNHGESIGTVYNTFLIYLLKNTYGDEMGDRVLHDFFIIQNMPYRSIQLLLKDSTSSWFDNINTQNIETRDEIIRNSLSDAIEFLKTKFDNQDINTWHWGILHKVKFRHPLGMAEALDKAFNIGPFDIGGDQTTLNNTEYQFNNVIENSSFFTVVGASMRMIVKMHDPAHPYSINSTGQSGQPVHTNYRDQARMWQYGEYRKNTMNELEMLQKNYSLLMLLPSN